MVPSEAVRQSVQGSLLAARALLNIFGVPWLLPHPCLPRSIVFSPVGPNPPFYEDTSHIRLDAHPNQAGTHPNLTNYICEEPISKCCHMRATGDNDFNIGIWGWRGHNSMHNRLGLCFWLTAQESSSVWLENHSQRRPHPVNTHTLHKKK